MIPDAALNSVSYTPQLVRWSDQDQMWDEVPRKANHMISLDWQFHIATDI